MNRLYFGDNLEILKSEIKDASVDLIYIDPPFNTGKARRLGAKQYDDKFDDLQLFLEPRLEEAYRVLADHGTLYFHIDYREVHRCKILLDQIFGRDHFLNEIIWAYDYGGRSKTRWPAKHDSILVYVKTLQHYRFNPVEVDEISFSSPNNQGVLESTPPTDTWWHTIVQTNGKERTGYPTQKPVGILDRILKASSNPGDLVLDFFAGSGTTGESCLKLDRQFILIDNNLQAIEVMQQRFKRWGVDIELIVF
jgi:site-specific DNA-methyltransferase (adenine-specific)